MEAWRMVLSQITVSRANQDLLRNYKKIVQITERPSAYLPQGLLISKDPTTSAPLTKTPAFTKLIYKILLPKLLRHHANVVSTPQGLPSVLTYIL